MSTWEPEAWSFSDDTFKKFESHVSSSDDSSDDVRHFSKMKTLKKMKCKKKIEREKRSFE